MPFMLGWILQWKANVPAADGVSWNVAPLLRLPLPVTEASSKVTVCGASSLLVHVIVSPTLAETADGLNAKFRMPTATAAPPAPPPPAEAGAAVGAAVGALEAVLPEHAATARSAVTARANRERRTGFPPGVPGSIGSGWACGEIRPRERSGFRLRPPQGRRVATLGMRRYRSAMSVRRKAQDHGAGMGHPGTSAAAMRSLELHEALAHAHGTRAVEDLGDAILLHDTRDADPFLNRLSAVRLPADPAACDRRLTELLARFASLGRRPHVRLAPGFHEPPDLHERLLDDGFVEVGGTYAMVLEDADAAVVRLPPGVRVERLAEAGDRWPEVVAAAARVMTQAFDAEPGAEDVIADDIARTTTGAWDACVVWLGHEPVAAGRRYTAHGMTYLSSIGTRPSWRGRGFASAVTAALVQDGSRAGGPIVHLAVEWENDRAQRMYRGLGFEILGGRVVDLLL